jgi:YD repeat-containing protein
MRIARVGRRGTRIILGWLLAACLALGAAHAGAAEQRYVYDELGRLIAVIDPAGETTHYSYDEAGNLTSVSRASSAQVSIAAFTPSRGRSGDAVSIFGTGFSATPAQNEVTFNGTPAVVTSSTTTSIVAVVPVAAASGLIRVTTPTGSAESAQPFTVVVPQPPQIAAFSPPIVTPNATVVISGSAFEPVPAENQVRVNASTAVVIAATDESLTVRAPNATGGKITVQTLNGSASSAADLFIVPSPNVAADVAATARIALDSPGAVLSLPANRIGLALFDATAGAAGVKVSVRDVTTSSGTITVYAPNGATLTSTSFGSGGVTLSLPVLPAGGSYGVRLTGSGTAGSVTLGVFQDVGGTLAPDTPVDISITNPAQVARFTFSISGGEGVGFDLRNVTLPSGGTISVTSPGGSTFIHQTFGTSGASVRAGTLGQPGIYTVTVTPANNGTGNVRLTLWRDVTGQLAVDSPQAASVAYGGQQIEMTFVVTEPGQAFGIRLADPTFGGTISVTSPGGSTFVNQSFSAGPGPSVRMGTLGQTGTYRVRIVPSSPATGSVQLTLWQDVTGQLALDTPKAATVNFGNQQIQVTFEITQPGQSLGIELAAPSFGGTISVTSPGGSTFINQTFNATTASIRIGTLGQLGIYRVTIVPAPSATGTVQMTLWQDVGGTLNVGELNAVPVQYPNQQVRKTFTLTSPQSLGLDLSNFVGFTSGTLSVTSPGGSTFINQTVSGAAGAGIRLGTLGQLGTYTVVFVPASSGTGTFDMRLWSDVAGTLAVDAPFDAAFAYRGQQARLAFNLAAPDSLGIDLRDVTLPSGGTLSVTSPGGSTFINTTFGIGGASVRMGSLGQLGPYAVLINPANNGTGNLRATLWRDVGGQLVLNTPKPATVAFANQQIQMTFELTQSQTLGIELAAPSFGGTISVTSPGGSTFINQSFNATTGASVRMGTLGQLGTYRVTIVPASSGTGTVQVTLWQDVPGALNVGELSSVAVQFPNQQVRKTFSLTSAQTLGLDLSNLVGFTSGTLSVTSPGGSTFINQTVSGAAGAGIRFGALGQLGTYTVVFVPASSGTGTFDMRLWSDVSDTLALDTAYALSIPYRNQQARLPFTISANENLRLILNDIAMPGGGTATLSSASGFNIASVTFGTTSTSTDFPTLSAGTYFVSVIPSASGTGTLTVRVVRR